MSVAIRTYLCVLLILESSPLKQYSIVVKNTKSRAGWFQILLLSCTSWALTMWHSLEIGEENIKISHHVQVCLLEKFLREFMSQILKFWYFHMLSIKVVPVSHFQKVVRACLPAHKVTPTSGTTKPCQASGWKQWWWKWSWYCSGVSKLNDKAVFASVELFWFSSKCYLHYVKMLSVWFESFLNVYNCLDI